jgi:hypothetical protein
VQLPLVRHQRLPQRLDALKVARVERLHDAALQGRGGRRRARQQGLGRAACSVPPAGAASGRALPASREAPACARHGRARLQLADVKQRATDAAHDALLLLGAPALLALQARRAPAPLARAAAGGGRRHVCAPRAFAMRGGGAAALLVDLHQRPLQRVQAVVELLVPWVGGGGRRGGRGRAATGMGVRGGRRAGGCSQHARAGAGARKGGAGPLDSAAHLAARPSTRSTRSDRPAAGAGTAAAAGSGRAMLLPGGGSSPAPPLASASCRAAPPSSPPPPGLRAAGPAAGAAAQVGRCRRGAERRRRGGASRRTRGAGAGVCRSGGGGAALQRPGRPPRARRGDDSIGSGVSAARGRARSHCRGPFRLQSARLRPPLAAGTIGIATAGSRSVPGRCRHAPPRPPASDRARLRAHLPIPRWPSIRPQGSAGASCAAFYSSREGGSPQRRRVRAARARAGMALAWRGGQGRGGRAGRRRRRQWERGA